MTPIIHPTGVGITHGVGDGLSEFPSDLADAGTAGSAAAFSVQASDTSALVTLAPSILGSGDSALPMRVLVAVSGAAVADSMIKPADFRGDVRWKSCANLFVNMNRKFSGLARTTRHNGCPGHPRGAFRHCCKLPGRLVFRRGSRRQIETERSG